MADNGSGQRAFSLGWIALALVGIFLGARSYQVSSAVLGKTAQSVVSGATATGADSLADRSTAEAGAPCGRNPFAPPASTGGVVLVKKEPEEPPPVARFLMVDKADRVVQIAVGDSILSPRLHIGGSFLGWKVVDIRPTSVTVSKAGKTVVLPSP